MAEYDRSATGPLPVDAGPRRAESIFDMSPADFRASLGEMQALGHDTDALMRQYRARNSIFAPINNAAAAQQQGLADSGRRSVLGGLLSKPEGALGMDALAGLEFEGLGGLLGAGQAVGQAIDAPAAAAQGLIPQADVNMEALNTAGMAMGAGGAATAPRGALRSNALMGGGRSDPTQTGWTFRDVAQPVRQNPTRSDDFIPMTPSESQTLQNGLGVRQQRVPIRSLLATQDRVDAEFSNRPIDGDRPLVVRKNGNMYIRDGHHRLTRIAEDGGSMADVDMIDFDNADTSTPLLDYREPTQSQRAAASAENDALFADLFGDMSESDMAAMLSANASQSGGLLGAGLSEAQRQARDILDMRAAGRAGEVTDDMMSRADDQYMFDNTPLPMDEASRLARADAGGFGGDLYHGTADEYGIDSFDVSKAGSVSQQPNERAIFATDSPDAASWFANYADPDGELATYGGATMGTVMPVMRRGDYQTLDFRGQPYGNSRMERGLESARRAGADGVSVRGMRENLDGFNPIINQEAIFAPTNIRSRFARFDPEFSHLSNLSAANASPTAGLLAMQQEQDKPLPFMEMLRGLLR
jgi:hypothetical protein